MSEEEKKKINKRILIISIVVIVALIASLILMGVFHLVDTILYPIVISTFLLIYWVIANVLDITWAKGFEGKTPAQKKAYYTYAAIDFVGLAGLVYFLVDMNSMTGALIYVASMMFKRKFLEEFRGTDGETSKEEDADGEISQEEDTDGKISQEEITSVEISKEEDTD